MSSNVGTIVTIKTVSTIRPQFFYKSQNDSPDASTIDLGRSFWNDRLRIAAEDGALSDNPLIKAAAQTLPAVTATLAALQHSLPPMDTIITAQRVIDVLTHHYNQLEPAYETHLARGLIAREYDQYDLRQILDAATEQDSPIAILLKEYVHKTLIHTPDLFRITIRNDGELHQALVVAALLRRSHQSALIALDCSSGNEQFAFLEWLPLFLQHQSEISRFFDFFIPKQTYGVATTKILEALNSGNRASRVASPFFYDLRYPFEPVDITSDEVSEISHAFQQMFLHTPVFSLGGERSVMLRLFAERCHWSACTFCTINAQHYTKRGSSAADAATLERIEELCDLIERKQVESVILTDEALHPRVLTAIADRVVARGLSIRWRARCRFTNELNDSNVCNLLGRSGLRYLGMGLESASARINWLFNKHRGAAIDYEQILQRLEEAGVAPHIYAIMGFPTETIDEINATQDFLHRQIASRKYVTVSANLFYYMRGSELAKRNQQPGPLDSEVTGSVALTLPSSGLDVPAHDAAVGAAAAIYQAEFAPWATEPDVGERIWHFIDQTGIFYLQKVFLERNPSHVLAKHSDSNFEPDKALRFKYAPRIRWQKRASRRELVEHAICSHRF